MRKPCNTATSRIQSRALNTSKPATMAGFSFREMIRDKMGTKKYINYKPAKLSASGEKWFVYFSFRDPVTDKFKRFKLYFSINEITSLPERKEYAQDLVRATNEALAEGLNPFKSDLQVVLKNWTVIQAFNYYKQKLPELGLRKKTTDSYESFITLLSEGFKNYWNASINDIGQIQCEEVLAQLTRKRGWGNTNRNNALTFGRLMFSFLMQKEIATKNPFKSVKPLQETKKKNKPFSDEDYELIKKEAPADLRRFMDFMYHTGTRPNEARQLTYDHILRSRKLLMIPGILSKGKKDGYVPVSDQFLELFPEGKGMIFGKSKNYFTAKFTTLKRKLKLNEDYTLYSIKPTRAVHLAEDGASPYAIMQLFRHSSLEITMEYLRGLGINIGREAAEKVR